MSSRQDRKPPGTSADKKNNPPPPKPSKPGAPKPASAQRRDAVQKPPTPVPAKPAENAQQNSSNTGK